MMRSLVDDQGDNDYRLFSKWIEKDIYNFMYMKEIPFQTSLTVILSFVTEPSTWSVVSTLIPILVVHVPAEAVRPVMSGRLIN
jgi:hypothetical protein